MNEEQPVIFRHIKPILYLKPLNSRKETKQMISEVASLLGSKKTSLDLTSNNNLTNNDRFLLIDVYDEDLVEMDITFELKSFESSSSKRETNNEIDDFITKVIEENSMIINIGHFDEEEDWDKEKTIREEELLAITNKKLNNKNTIVYNKEEQHCLYYVVDMLSFYLNAVFGSLQPYNKDYKTINQTYLLVITKLAKKSPNELRLLNNMQLLNRNNLLSLVVIEYMILEYYFHSKGTECSNEFLVSFNTLVQKELVYMGWDTVLFAILTFGEEYFVQNIQTIKINAEANTVQLVKCIKSLVYITLVKHTDVCSPFGCHRLIEKIIKLIVVALQNTQIKTDNLCLEYDFYCEVFDKEPKKHLVRIEKLNPSILKNHLNSVIINGTKLKEKEYQVNTKGDLILHSQLLLSIGVNKKEPLALKHDNTNDSFYYHTENELKYTVKGLISGKTNYSLDIVSNNQVLQSLEIQNSLNTYSNSLQIFLSSNNNQLIEFLITNKSLQISKTLKIDLNVKHLVSVKTEIINTSSCVSDSKINQTFQSKITNNTNQPIHITQFKIAFENSKNSSANQTIIAQSEPNEPIEALSHNESTINYFYTMTKEITNNIESNIKYTITLQLNNKTYHVLLNETMQKTNNRSYHYDVVVVKRIQQTTLNEYKTTHSIYNNTPSNLDIKFKIFNNNGLIFMSGLVNSSFLLKPYSKHYLTNCYYTAHSNSNVLFNNQLLQIINGDLNVLNITE